MMKATTEELSSRTAELLAATDRGESVIITVRGERRAVLQRWPEETTQVHERNPAFGLRSDQEDNVDELVRRVRSER